MSPLELSAVLHIYTSLRSQACGWPGTLHPPPPVEVLASTPRSHPWLGAPGPRHAVCGASSYASSDCSRWRHSVQITLPGARATGLVQPSCWQRLPPPCAMQCGLPPVCLGAALVLAAPATSMHDAVLGIASSRLGAALVMAPFAPSMHDAVRRAAALSQLDTAIVLAPPASSVHHAALLAALSSSSTSLVLAAFAPAVRDAIPRAASSRLKAALLLAPPAASMCLAMGCRRQQRT
jgi:hypothetical protein